MGVKLVSFYAVPKEMIKVDQKEALVRLAIAEAEKAAALGNAPFGALLINPQGEVELSAFNTQRSDLDPTAHAEINLLREAGKKFKTIYFPGYSIVGNAEACSMCMSAAIKSKITSFLFGAFAEPSMDPELPAKVVAAKAKSIISLIGGVLAHECMIQITQVRKSQKR